MEMGPSFHCASNEIYQGNKIRATRIDNRLEVACLGNTDRKPCLDWKFNIQLIVFLVTAA